MIDEGIQKLTDVVFYCWCTLTPYWTLCVTLVTLYVIWTSND